MAFEVTPVLGEIRAADARVALGDTAGTASSIDVMVLADAGGLPFVGRLDLVRIGGGPGRHLAFCCPRCREPRRLLLTDGHGGIRCSRCARARTKRQLRRTCRSWKYLGDREFDELLRLLRPRSTSPAHKRQRAQLLVDELLAGDRDRLGVVADVVDAALRVVSAEPGAGALRRPA